MIITATQTDRSTFEARVNRAVYGMLLDPPQTIEIDVVVDREGVGRTYSLRCTNSGSAPITLSGRILAATYGEPLQHAPNWRPARLDVSVDSMIVHAPGGNA